MAIEVKVPKEITEYQEKILFGLSIRQLLASTLAVVMTLGLYPFLIKSLGKDTGQILVIMLVAPIWAIGFIKKNNMTFEKYAMNVVKHYFSQKKRYYATNLNKFIIEERENEDVKHKKENKSEYESWISTKRERKQKLKKTKKQIRQAKKEFRIAKRRIKKETQVNCKGEVNARNNQLRANVRRWSMLFRR